MELENKVGQLILIGLPGTGTDSATRELLETIQPGGVLLGSHNIESARQVSELTSSIRSILKVPPLIAIHQEGGRIDPLKDIFSPMPSADHLRISDDASIAARYGEITAESLRTLGFNVNFAPLLDIPANNATDNGLEGRYLGDNVAHIVRLAGAYLEGLQHGGVVGVGKHFPGLGSAKEDPHSELPTIDSSRDQILNRDLVPYTESFSKINARLSAIIIGHAHYPAFDGPAALPASLSRKVVSGLLRDELGFKGLAIADNLEMGAITSTRELPEAAVMAMEAGNDMVIVAGSPENATQAWQAMIDAVQQGRVEQGYISKAFNHIARIKSMVSPPHQWSEVSITRLRERVAELNLLLQHSN